MAEENTSPISATKPPVANPISSPTSHHASTLKLKPVIRKPTLGGAGARPSVKLPTAAKPVSAPQQEEVKSAVPEVALESASTHSSSIDQLRSATQKLKGLTQQIPQQAILHKTGIIAEEALTESQKMASKSRTARISLSDAIGVAPVKNEAAPMKTIRIKRPVGIGPSPSSTPVKPEQKPVAEPVPSTSNEEHASPKAEESKPSINLTQRKTLKIARPGAQVRPAGKFSVKKPAAPEVEKKDDSSSEGEVADIADIPEIPLNKVGNIPAEPVCPPNAIPDVCPACQVVGLLIQIASCVAMGFLVWKLYEACQLPAYCGGAIL